MTFAYTILYVDDVAASLDFYRRAFGFRLKMQHDSGDYGELDSGNTTLSFSSRRLMKELGKNPGRPQPNAPVFEIAFVVDDVAQALAQAVAAGATLVQEAEAMPWGQVVGYVTDNHGFLVELCTAL